MNKCLGSNFVNYITDIPKSAHNKKYAQKALQIFSICITDAYHDYILEKNYTPRQY